ncbi:MAG: pantetheine-phosphate adenylyltransferase [Bacteroidia bacterium]|nr:pantetheine-phosphate adenylyltransferase [Bacteroidia bacterium]NNF29850.1 pantetheine-phosphate adenylyltransferase [Flavobacteriaceae bacterium]NNJ81483.1 pantetheine-phosphate adenylyltransferase [Flavobacteriaceae bacterium]NNK54193.1 pantetheine-phosphate adenylyltransferase [Flavobacteriaceae bacterium]NNM10088.1 pantetheine-phosphate adenylyltransferase [Flavobacteriaceae bacterium]
MIKAVFPGSFDPITLGHVDIIERALPLFDEIIVAIGINAEKKYMWSLDDRKAFLEKTFAREPKIKVATYTGLTAEFCKKVKARYILRGLRNTSDFAYEQTIAQANDNAFGVDSMFLMGSPEMSYISSTVVRDIARHGGDYSSFVPPGVQ